MASGFGTALWDRAIYKPRWASTWERYEWPRRVHYSVVVFPSWAAPGITIADAEMDGITLAGNREGWREGRSSVKYEARQASDESGLRHQARWVPQQDIDWTGH